MGTWTKIVAGVDGSEAGNRALAWAAGEARQHGAVLTAVTVWSSPAALAGPRYASEPWYLESDLSTAMGHVQSAALDTVLGAHPDVKVERVLVQGHPAQHLLEVSAGADLLVVGCRGYGGVVGMLLGSVSQHVTAHATCPVVVVR
jgi:nucleotide-binding universal stress UspA family protein